MGSLMDVRCSRRRGRISRQNKRKSGRRKLQVRKRRQAKQRRTRGQQHLREWQHKSNMILRVQKAMHASSTCNLGMHSMQPRKQAGKQKPGNSREVNERLPHQHQEMATAAQIMQPRARSSAKKI